MFKPLISKYARQLPCDCAETDLIIAMLEFIRDLDAERIKSCNDAVLVSYITPMLRNKKIDIYRNVASKNLVVVNVDYDLCEFRNYDIDERIDCMNCLNQLSDKQRNILIRRFIMGYSDAEIAQQLKISRQAVCKTKNKALNNLKLIWVGAEGA
jgi:RNA polymerase sigma factor (sigma-70 family)